MEGVPDTIKSKDKHSALADAKALYEMWKTSRISMFPVDETNIHPDTLARINFATSEKEG
jgi:hypothetical protein